MDHPARKLRSWRRVAPLPDWGVIIRHPAAQVYKTAVLQARVLQGALTKGNTTISTDNPPGIVSYDATITP